MSLAQPPIHLPAPAAPADRPDPIFPLSVVQYHEMIRTGILTDEDPVELLEGLLVVKMPKYPPHSTATELARQGVGRVLPGGWYVRVQEPVTLADSEPEPDLAVVRGDPGRYATRHPSARDVGLVIEVADASLERDRRIKARVYAAAKVPFYWIINLTGNVVEVYSRPTGPGAAPAYRRRQEYGIGDDVPVRLGRANVGRVRVADLLPARRRRT